MMRIGLVFGVGAALMLGCQESQQLPTEIWTFDASIRALTVAENGDIWWAGSNGLVGYTADKGATWSVDTLRLTDNTTPAFRSIAVTENAAFALTIASPAVLFKRDLISETGKAPWRVVYENADSLAFFDSMAFWDVQEGIAMGDPLADCLSILITRDAGETWNLLPCAALPSVVSDSTGAHEAAFAASNGNVVVSGDEAWVVSGGLASRVFRTADRGRTWDVVETPIVQGGQMTGMFSAARCNEMLGLGWGGNWEDMDDNSANKVVTTDGGASWSLSTPGQGPGYRSCVQYVPGSECQQIWAVGIPGISTSVDGGATWQTEADSSYYTVRFNSDGTEAWLAGRGKVQRRATLR